LLAHNGKLIDEHFSPPQTVSNREKRTLKGIVRDSKTNVALPYVNIGVLNKDIGTTTDTRGTFELEFSNSTLEDTLKISIVGYESKKIAASTFPDATSVTFHLDEKPTVLKEAVIESKKLKTKRIGNRSQSKFFGGKFASNDLGSEFAIKIHIRNTLTYLENFRFNISYNDVDTAAFRFNIYSIKNGLPFENITPHNIIARIGKNQTGTVQVDLSKYNIILHDDFFIGLEWIEGNTTSGIVFSAGFGHKAFYRRASQGRWRKYPMGIGINIDVKY
jgi:hypothetical protein